MTAQEVCNLELDDLIRLGDFECTCGKVHSPGVEKVIIEKGAVGRLPGLLDEMGLCMPFILSGHDTFAAAGKAVMDALSSACKSFSKFVFPVSPVRPTEQTVGSALMHFDYSCDSIIGIGSGVINDTAKMLAKATGLKYIVVATAPSMDGYVSATSSMDRDGLKVSIDSKAACCVIGDLDILCSAPMHMLAAGVGDMLAKVVSLTEWKIANIILGEYYCDIIAALVNKAVDKVIANSSGLMKREPEAVRAVMEGLIIAGISMNYAQVSRPAAGMEHYFSHIWDMRALAFDDSVSDLHGVQTGTGTVYSLMAYEDLMKNCSFPDRLKAEKYVKSFSTENWNRNLTEFIGPGASAMIEAESRDRKYDPKIHAGRISTIIENWDEICGLINNMPPSDEIRELMSSVGLPTDAGYLGYDKESIKKTFLMTKDIRDKYVGSRLLWDLGILEETADRVFLK